MFNHIYNKTLDSEWLAAPNKRAITWVSNYISLVLDTCYFDFYVIRASITCAWMGFSPLFPGGCKTYGIYHSLLHSREVNFNQRLSYLEICWWYDSLVIGLPVVQKQRVILISIFEITPPLLMAPTVSQLVGIDCVSDDSKCLSQIISIIILFW